MQSQSHINERKERFDNVVSKLSFLLVIIISHSYCNFTITSLLISSIDSKFVVVIFFWTWDLEHYLEKYLPVVGAGLFTNAQHFDYVFENNNIGLVIVSVMCMWQRLVPMTWITFLSIVWDNIHTLYIRNSDTTFLCVFQIHSSFFFYFRSFPKMQMWW